MYTKICFECGRESHSSSKDGEWICPYDDCGADLTEVEVENKGSGKKDGKDS